MKRILIIVAIQRKADRLQVGLGFASQRKSKGRPCNSYDIINFLLHPPMCRCLHYAKHTPAQASPRRELSSEIKGEVKRFLSEVLLWNPLCVEKVKIWKVEELL